MHGSKHFVLHMELIFFFIILNSIFVLLEPGFPHALQCFFVNINSPRISLSQSSPVVWIQFQPKSVQWLTSFISKSHFNLKYKKMKFLKFVSKRTLSMGCMCQRKVSGAPNILKKMYCGAMIEKRNWKKNEFGNGRVNNL